MEDTRVFIVAGGKGSRLYPLTKNRAKPAVPFAGNRRIVDCALSSCIYSGLRKVNVLVYYVPRSLIRYIQTKWDISSPGINEYIYAEAVQLRAEDDAYFGDADAVRKNLYLLDEELEERLLILGGDHIYKMDFRQLIVYHLDQKSKLTVAAFETTPQEAASTLGVLEVNRDDKIVGFQEKPVAPQTMPNSNMCLASMGIYLFEIDFLREVLQKPGSSFGHDLLPQILGEDIYAYNFTRYNTIPDFILRFREGKRYREYVERPEDSTYFRDVGSLEAYWQANMDLVGVNPTFNLYTERWRMGSERPPAKLVNHELLVCDGSIINSAQVFRSVISPGVIIESGAQVTDSIIFDNAWIGQNTKVHRAIIDKYVKVAPGAVIDGQRLEGHGLVEDEDYKVTESGLTVIAKGVELR
ncbi:MAG: hypothetical protein A2Z27_01685 [candidate division Zixibacteria bacterium RBG_16_50_21]|nr:MAG: hypothetical protein A2Z27_01685 [candidate division Zixibacteria bacterium RBG_16_50_21]